MKKNSGDISPFSQDPIIEARIRGIQLLRGWGEKRGAAGLAALLVREFPACKQCRKLMADVVVEANLVPAEPKGSSALGN
ncbi:MAG TPA: hypothetical protein VD770_03945 [Coxiellaceae bacterium]|nr:hypothetical protein [Coxiellaceae bacterium]